ncbi:MAG: hypothetical protein GWN00_29950, partial [Aliifodinibius sp.]|nr:hypothetical protein [Fodinibius sp.]NIX02447.1 hypothetical protein [Phycisphaerae bacterium]NIY28862.1 hypothetical protein [Fodinibius sp.]
MSLPGGSVDVDNGERHIISSQSVDVTEMIQYPRLEHLIHEFGHIWGLPHNYSGGFWSLMGHRYPNVSSFMNSYERERLGWMTFTDVTVNNTNVTIADFGTAAVAYRVRIDTNNVYLLENHQCISPYDVVNKLDPDLNP